MRDKQGKAMPCTNPCEARPCNARLRKAARGKTRQGEQGNQGRQGKQAIRCKALQRSARPARQCKAMQGSAR
eukprot:5531574-Alexandrium_andersonii.AAC.1